MTRWLLCDYGNVLSTPQPPGDLARLSEVAEMETEALTEPYWAHRLAYDRADVDVATYWALVLGAPVATAHLAALVAADVASWSHLNHDTLAATRRAEGRGWRLALLSNAPVEVARAVERLDELAAFSPRWFSCDLKAAKPEPVVFEQVLAALGGQAPDVTFVDDRADNVAGAAAAGLQAVLFEDPAQIDAL